MVDQVLITYQDIKRNNPDWTDRMIEDYLSLKRDVIIFDTDVSGIVAQVAANTSDIGTNEVNIATNATDIRGNEAEISAISGKLKAEIIKTNIRLKNVEQLAVEGNFI